MLGTREGHTAPVAFVALLRLVRSLWCVGGGGGFLRRTGRGGRGCGSRSRHCRFIKVNELRSVIVEDRASHPAQNDAGVSDGGAKRG
jgi:hypothetical protein